MCVSCLSPFVGVEQPLCNDSNISKETWTTSHPHINSDINAGITMIISKQNVNHNTTIILWFFGRFCFLFCFPVWGVLPLMGSHQLIWAWPIKATMGWHHQNLWWSLMAPTTVDSPAIIEACDFLNVFVQVLFTSFTNTFGILWEKKKQCLTVSNSCFWFP